MASAIHYDVLVATDCRFPAGNTASVVDEIRAQARGGYRTGLLHVPSPLVQQHRSFAPSLRQVLDEGTADLIVDATDIRAKLLIVRHPSVFAQRPVDLPRVHVDRVLLVANAVPAGEQRYEHSYDAEQVTRQLENAVGTAPEWAPISPIVRDALAPYVPSSSLLPWDWECVLDLAAWHVERTGFVSDRPVLGRHTRDHWTKWPKRRRDLLAAYPDDPRYRVRVLGGTDTPAEIIGYLPANWASLPFGSVPPPAFLASIDFFVYAHHRRVIEPFGRAVLEALAAGAATIVPPELEPVYGDACRYGRPSDVQGYVDELYGDWDAFAARSRAGVELVTKRFGYDTHLERLTSLIGEPAAPVAAVTAAPPDRGSLVVDLTRGESLDPMVSSVVRATVSVGGPRVVALPARRAADLTARVAVETFPRALDEMPAAARRQYLRTRLAGIVQAHQPVRMLVVDDGHGAVRDVLATAGALTDTWLIQPGDASDPGYDTVATEVASILPTGWTIARLTQPDAAGATPESGLVDTSLSARLLRRLRRWVAGVAGSVRRRLLSWLRDDPRAAGLLLVELDETEHALPVRAGAGQRATELLPVALVVIIDEYGDPVEGVRAIVKRQHVAGTFRTALLAPPDWEPSATAAGLTVETLLPEPLWTTLYGAGWPAYLRQRVQQSCQAVGAATVVFADRPIAGSGSASAVLDVIEAARVRQAASTRARSA